MKMAVYVHKSTEYENMKFHVTLIKLAERKLGTLSTTNQITNETF